MAKDITAKGYLSGNITAKASLSGDITASGALGQTITLEQLPMYDGETEINPDFIGKVLQTAQKKMPDNITVNPIQVESVSNIQGGRTVYIGGII